MKCDIICNYMVVCQRSYLAVTLQCSIACYYLTPKKSEASTAACTLVRSATGSTVYSSCVTATCRSVKITLGMIPKISATISIGSTSMNSRREISVVNDRYCEYAPNDSRLNRKIL